MPRRRPQNIAQNAVQIIAGRQRSCESVNRRQLDVVVQFFAQRHSRAPSARRTAVVGEPVRENILKEIAGRQIVAAPKNCHMPVVIVETGHLHFPRVPSLRSVATSSCQPLCNTGFPPCHIRVGNPSSSFIAAASALFPASLSASSGPGPFGSDVKINVAFQSSLTRTSNFVRGRSEDAAAPSPTKTYSPP